MCILCKQSLTTAQCHINISITFCSVHILFVTYIHTHKQHMLAKPPQRLISPWIIIPSGFSSYNSKTIVYQGMTVRTIHRSSALSPRIPCCTKQQSAECDQYDFTENMRSTCQGDLLNSQAEKKWMSIKRFMLKLNS